MPRHAEGRPESRPAAPAGAASIGPATEDLKALLVALPGACAEPVPMPRGAPPPAIMYKLMGKIFAILSIRGDAFIIVKCSPELVDILRQTYSGIGHRSHLDRRFWISIELNADVPPPEIVKLVEGSYALIHNSLTRKQKEQTGLRSGG
jgi:predicted DNA-binding protein (MmcQ/YjbR family)